MMQHVATAKSEVAAFATGAQTNSFAGSESNEQFGKLLQDQTSLHSVAGASESTSHQSSNKKSLQQPTDEVQKNPSSAVTEDTATQVKSDSNERLETQEAQSSTTSKANTILGAYSEAKASDKSELSVANTKVELQLVLPSKQNDVKPDVESASIVAQEWVSLVDNLQKLADSARLKKQPLVDVEVTPQDVSVAGLRLSNKFEKGLLEHISDKQTLEKLNITTDETSLLPFEENNVAVKIVPDDQVLVAKKQVEQSISILVDKALGEVLANQESQGLVDIDVRKEMVVLLLEQPEVLQDLINQLESASQKNGTGNLDQITLDNVIQNDLFLASQQVKKTAKLELFLDKVIENDSLLANQKTEIGAKVELLLEKVTEKDSLLANQKLEISANVELSLDKVTDKDSLLADHKIENGGEVDGQVDLTLAENKALLKTLLIDSETDKTPVQESVKLVNPVVSDTPEIPVQAQQAATSVTTVESDAEPRELLEEDIQVAQVAPSHLLNSGKIEQLSSNDDIKNILNLTDNKLDKVLENIAQRVFDTKKTEAISPEQVAQQVVIPKAAEIITSVESSSKDFILALKSGLEEFKNQLSQGREPGIDLKALVSDALVKITDKGDVAKTPVNLEQVLKSVSQVLDFAQTMNRTIEQHHDQAYSATLRDVAQIQGEQSKQIQLNQFESKFDKAINIAKPEGHQLLAEKVRWMVNTKNLVAEIRLDPAELGSIHVKVAMSGESATVNFVVQSQQARDAVDNATPRLKEMLAEKGIELGQSSVRQESEGQQGQGDDELAKQNGDSKNGAEDVEVPDQVLAQHKIVNGALGGIDYFV